MSGTNPKNPSHDDIGISSEDYRVDSSDFLVEEDVAPIKKAEDPLIGYLVGGQWKMERRVAEGGMGVVYEATHHQRAQRVAVKILQTVLRMDSLHIDRFYHEARILQRLRHPNIVSVYEFGFEEGLGFYLVMELLHGCGLDVYLQLYQGQMPLDVLCHIFVQICEGMHYAHEEGVLHRDLKPENIFILQPVQGFERLKLLDFGVGKIVQDKVNAITQHGKTVGTPRYISPEQAVGTPLDRRTDVYSLAVILFEILTGGPLFKAENPAEYMSQHVFTDPPFLSEVAGIGTFPQGIEELLADCLSKHPEHRPDTMLVFRDRLIQSLVDEGIPLPETVQEVMQQSIEEPIEESIGSYMLNFSQTQRRERVSLHEGTGGDTSAIPQDRSKIPDLEAEKRALRARRFQRDDHIPEPEPPRSFRERWDEIGPRRWVYIGGVFSILVTMLAGLYVFLTPPEEEPLVSDLDWTLATDLWSRTTRVGWLPHLKVPKAPVVPSQKDKPEEPRPSPSDAGGAEAAPVPDAQPPEMVPEKTKPLQKVKAQKKSPVKPAKVLKPKKKKKKARKTRKAPVPARPSTPRPPQE
ncbi:MAG: protein kinase [Myxococcales bacterium]|nr:protein kinase [Myxococcales bacterium]